MQLTTEPIFRNYQNVLQAFLHGDSFYSPSHTIRDAKNKTKQKQSEGLKSSHQSLKIHPSDWRHSPPNTYTQIIWRSSCVKFCAFKANKSAKHFTDGQGVSVDLK